MSVESVDKKFERKRFGNEDDGTSQKRQLAFFSRIGIYFSSLGESRRSSMEEIQKKTNFVFGRRSSWVPVTFERRSSLEAQAPAKSRRRRTHRKKPSEAPVPAPGLPRIQSEEYVP